MPARKSLKRRKSSSKRLSKRLRTMKRNSKRMSRKSMRGGNGCPYKRSMRGGYKGGLMEYKEGKILHPK